MNFTPLSPHFGATVSGFTQQSVDTLRGALARYGVLAIRGARCTAQEQAALAAALGEPLIDPHPRFGHVEDAPCVSVIINDADNPPDINVWHSDTSYLSEPATFCVLRSVETPPAGGDTLWVSMTAAFDALSAPVQALLRGLRAEHRLPLDSVPPQLARRALDGETLAVHPVVRRIPETGREALFVNRHYTKRIEGLGRTESAGLLRMLFEHAESADFQLRWQWQTGDVVMWDNRQTQHFAAADYFPHRRVMHRVALRGEVPVAAAHG